MQAKQLKLEYRIAHLVSTVAEGDAALVEALQADDSRRAELRQKFSYLLSAPVTAAPATKTVEPA